MRRELTSRPYSAIVAMGYAPGNRGITALAGVWENWQSPAGEWVRSFAIITTTPNQLCAEILDACPTCY